MENKLIIVGRTNWKKGFYIKFKAEEKSMKIIKKIIKELSSEYFVDDQTIPKTFNKYEKWKDKWIPVYSSKNNDLEIDIICGDKIIHMLVHKYPSLEFINKILDKYSVFAQPKYKKGFSSPINLE